MERKGISIEVAQGLMQKNNPAIVTRNFRGEEALEAAVNMVIIV